MSDEIREPGEGEIWTRVCPDCGQITKGPSSYGLRQHKQARHPEADWNPSDVPKTIHTQDEWEQSKVEHAHAAREEPPPPEYEEPATRVPPRTDLPAVERALAQNIEALGGMTVGALNAYKGFLVTHPGAAIRLSGQTRTLPYIETTFGHVVASRAPTTAAVVMGYASHNETLMRWVVRFNQAMTGGEVGGLVMAHAVGLAHTAAPTSGAIERAAGFVVPEAMARVMAENEELRRQVDHLRQQVATAAAGSAA